MSRKVSFCLRSLKAGNNSSKKNNKKINHLHLLLSALSWRKTQCWRKRLVSKNFDYILLFSPLTKRKKSCAIAILCYGWNSQIRTVQKNKNKTKTKTKTGSTGTHNYYDLRVFTGVRDCSAISSFAKKTYNLTSSRSCDRPSPDSTRLITCQYRMQPRFRSHGPPWPIIIVHNNVQPERNWRPGKGVRRDSQRATTEMNVDLSFTPILEETLTLFMTTVVTHSLGWGIPLKAKERITIVS